jgi:hypothetical protein
VSTDELVSLEHAGWRSLCEGTGGRFYGELMTPDAVMVLAHGQVLDRPAVVASLDGAPAWASYEIVDARAVEVGQGAVALVYTGRASRGGDDRDFVALMSSVYTRRAGRWRLALYQQTPVPAAG